MNIYKERFCYFSEFLTKYIEDIMTIDNYLVNESNFWGLNELTNFESLGNKRKRYKMKEAGDGFEIDSYRNTMQRIGENNINNDEENEIDINAREIMNQVKEQTLNVGDFE